MYIREGDYPGQLPRTIGIEGAGVISECGEEVKDFVVSDRVAFTGLGVRD